MVKKTHSGFDRLTKAIIKWGYNCNNDCVFCHSADFRVKDSLSTEEIKRKIYLAKRLKVEMVLFSGGEPLLIEELKELFKYSFAKRMYSGLITNGRLLYNRERVENLYNLGLRYVYMSLVSLNPDTYYKITNTYGLNQSLKAIMNIKSFYSIMFTINIPIIKYNIGEIIDTAVKLALSGVDRIKLSVVEPKGYALKNYKEVVPSLSETASVIAETIKEVQKANPETKIYHDGLPVCLSPDYEKYNRDMYSENILYMSESFEKRFFPVDYKNMDYVKGVCEICNKKKICRGIYTGYIEAGDIPLFPYYKKKIQTTNKADLIYLNKDKNYEVNIGKICNNACIFCANGVISKEENRFVEFEKIKSEIKKAYSEGFRSLGFLGGEITIHPDVIRIIEFARDTGFRRIAICTNGRKLSDINFAKRLVTSGVTRFMISIHSHIESIENYLNGRKNAFSEKIKGISNLVHINKKFHIEHGISLNTCIHNLNYKTLEEFIVFFKKLGILDFRFNFTRPENKARYDKNIIPKLTEIKPFLEKLIASNEEILKVNIAIGDIPFCLLPESLLKDRKLLEKYIGELRDLDTFVTTFASRTNPDYIDRFSWRERKSNFLKTKSPLCNRCVFDPLCEGLFKDYINLYGIKELIPIKNLPA